MKAVVLAGGRGERLRPLTDLVPKPLLPIWGRPALETLFVSLAGAQIQDVAVVVGYLGDAIRHFAGDGSAYGLRLSYYEQAEQRGSGDAVLAAADFIGGQPVLVVGADAPFGPDHVRGLIDLHAARAADAAVCLKRLPPERIARTSSVAVDEDGVIRAFVEKPAPGEAPSDLAAALLHIYPPSLPDYLARVGVSPRGEHELPAVLELMIADGLRVIGKEFPVAPDLTDPRDLLALNFDYLRPLLEQEPGS